MPGDRQAHWESVYSSKSVDEVSWHQAVPAPSLELAEAAGVGESTAVIDVGGGTARFVDCLLDLGLRDLTVLDLSSQALATAKARLGARASEVRWITADITRWAPDRQYDLWHDRAVFHFLTEAEDRAAYVACLTRALAPGGHAIIATFAPDGPDRCSGLPVVRYSPESLAQTLGTDFRLIIAQPHRHATPSGASQSFQFSLFRKV
jgi:trans-aconitate methyltransferase